MRVLIFEQWLGGHYFNYLECLVPRLAAKVDEVVVAVTEAAFRSPFHHEQMKALARIANVRFDLEVPIPQPCSAIALRFRLARNLIDAIRRNRPDHVFLPSADEQVLAYPLVAHGFRRPKPAVEAVVHFQHFLGKGSGRQSVVRAFERGLLRTGAFQKLSFVNFLQYEAAIAQSSAVARLSRAAGDPVPQPAVPVRDEARRALGLDPAGRWIGMVGALDARKAVIQTVRAFEKSALAPDDRLLLAGKLHRDYLSEIERSHRDSLRSGRIVVLDRYLTDAELVNCNAAIDLNCSVYQSFEGLSSLMLKSLAANVPVVTNTTGWGSAVARRFEVGKRVAPDDLDAYAKVLPLALEESAGYRRSAATDRLLRFHSVENFAAGMIERCVERLGRAPEPSHDWEWVMQAVAPERRALQ